ncbi:MAG: 3D domain-containing protein [Acidobacteria bacterium]|nr:3D domain-containing protein [Acidobacteriota bacterium]
MKKLAGGSLFLGVIAMVLALFYFEPKVEAKSYYTADDAQENLQQLIQQDNQSNPQIQQQESPTQKSLKDTIENSETESEFVSNAQHFKATAYCLKGRTASGAGVRRGIVAADRRVLPLGTRIQLHAGSYSGTYTVADTGGAVKGRILDVWVPSCSEAMRFGRRSVKVSVMGKRRNA